MCSISEIFLSNFPLVTKKHSLQTEVPEVIVPGTGNLEIIMLMPVILMLIFTSHINNTLFSVCSLLNQCMQFHRSEETD